MMTASAIFKHSRHRRTVGFFLLMSVLFVWPRTVSAQILSPDRFKNGALVKRAFRQAVSRTNRATVQVLVDGKQVALGAVVAADGAILTKAGDLTGTVVVRLPNGQKFPAQIVGVHKEYDLAMLKIASPTPAVIDWDKSGDPPVGSWLATTGSSGLPVAVGVVSVKRRAIPRQPGVLGIQIADADPGPRITRIFANSGAQRAGLKVGDIITRVAGRIVKSSEALSSRVRTFGPGEILNLTIRRGGSILAVMARLGYPNATFNTRRAIQNRMGGRLSNRRADFPVALQHDTVLRPEECGGPLVDLRGKVIGINIARAGRAKSYAIPADVILPLLDDLRSGKLAPQPTRAEPSAPPMSEVRTN